MKTTPLFNHIKQKGQIFSLILLVSFIISSFILPFTVSAQEITDSSPTYQLAKKAPSDSKSPRGNANNNEVNLDESSNQNQSEVIENDNQQTNVSETTIEDPNSALIPDILNYFFGNLTPATSTQVETETQVKEESTTIVPAPVDETPIPVTPTVPVKKPVQKPTQPKATTTAGTISSDDDLKKAESNELTKSSQVNPLLSFWKKDTSGYDSYLYVGLGATTTLVLLLLALLLGAGGFSLVLHDTLSQFGSRVGSRALAQRSFKNSLVSNQ